MLGNLVLLLAQLTLSDLDSCFSSFKSWNSILRFDPTNKSLNLQTENDESWRNCLNSELENSSSYYNITLIVNASEFSSLSFESLPFPSFISFPYAAPTPNSLFSLSFERCNKMKLFCEPKVFSSIIPFLSPSLCSLIKGRSTLVSKTRIELERPSKYYKYFLSLHVTKDENCSQILESLPITVIENPVSNTLTVLFSYNASYTFYCVKVTHGNCSSFFSFQNKEYTYCESHFECGWMYITALGSLVLFLSCLFSYIFVYCLCTPKRISSDYIVQSTPRSSIHKSWSELHEEWNQSTSNKNHGKVLLLYSRDYRAFTQLQNALKSFLENACHSHVLDLFDDTLFNEIAYNPEVWLSNLLVHDPDFKILIVESQGALKRQVSLLQHEVLNIPNNSTLDGLFSSGLQFIQDFSFPFDRRHRVATIKYEKLCSDLSQNSFQSISDKEFYLPSQLDQLFCWIHGICHEKYIGQPWNSYHLELQLLLDSLKNAKSDVRDLSLSLVI